MSAYRQDNTVHVDYVLEPEDLANEWSPLLRRGQKVANLAVGGVLVAAGLVFLVTLPPLAAAIAFAVGGLAIGWLLSKAKVNVSVENLYGKTWSERRRVRLEADESEFALIDPMIETRLAWDVVVHWDESADALRIYTQANAFHVIPKRAFQSPEQLIALRQLLEAHVSPSGEAKVTRSARDGWGARVMFLGTVGLIVLSIVEAVARLVS
ncbi:MAG: YcxB family protein [Sandaracinaceae bacterium]